MSRLLSALPLAALLLAAGPAAAAPRPDEKPAGPAVVGQAKSLNDLLEMTKAIVKNVGGDEIFKAFEREALPQLDPGKLPGIDPKRPFGLYGIIDAKLENCRGVLLLPVTSEKDFLDMLERFQIKVVKAKGDPGAFDFVTPPDVPFTVSGRIHKEYAYIAFGGPDVLDPKKILDPRDVISDKEKSAAYLSLRLDRVPADAKKALLAMVREQTERLREMIPEPDLKDAFQSAERLALRYLKMVLEEGKEVAFRLDADTKTGDVSLEMAVEPLPKSPLAEAVAKRSATKNAFASLTGDDYAQRLYVSAPLFADEMKDGLAKLIDFGSKSAAAEAARVGAAPELIALIEAAFKSLKANVESGEMDLAAAIRGPNKDGFYTAVGAVHCKEGAQLEKALRAAVKVLPERAQGLFKFDAGKIGDLSVHEIDLTSEAAEPAVKVFGKGNKAYFAFGKGALYASYGPDGMKLLKEAIEAKPGPAPVFDSSSNGKKAAELMKRLMPDQGPNGPAMRLGFVETATTGMRLTVAGGDKLKVRASLNVGMIILAGFGVYTTEVRPVAPPAAK